MFEIVNEQPELTDGDSVSSSWEINTSAFNHIVTTTLKHSGAEVSRVENSFRFVRRCFTWSTFIVLFESLYCLSEEETVGLKEFLPDVTLDTK